MTAAFRFIVRPLRLADEPFLWEIVYHAVYVSEGSTPPPRDIVHRPEVAKYVRGWGKSGDIGFVAVHPTSDRLVGAAWLRLLTGDDKGYGYVDDLTPELSIAVLPGYRGKGIGTELLTHLLAAAQTRYRGVSLNVAVDNPALRLYQRLGFQVVGTHGGSLTMIKSWHVQE
jgi:ribosomal protein S18 acetylase RimI-like enzyme